jgi:hypothetical protein
VSCSGDAGDREATINRCTRELATELVCCAIDCDPQVGHGPTIWIAAIVDRNNEGLPNAKAIKRPSQLGKALASNVNAVSRDDRIHERQKAGCLKTVTPISAGVAGCGVSQA